MNVDPNALPPAVRDALLRGDIIAAVKQLREARGISLTSAKALVDAVRAHAATGARPVLRGTPPAPQPHAAAQSPAARAPAHAGDATAPHSLYRPGLAPGEVPHTGSSIWSWIVLALGLLALVLFLRRP